MVSETRLSFGELRVLKEHAKKGSRLTRCWEVRETVPGGSGISILPGGHLESCLRISRSRGPRAGVLDLGC